MREAVTERTRIVFLASPDNPSGSANTSSEIEELVEALPDNVLFVLDEAYSEYQDEPVDLRPLIAKGKKVFCTRTFSKIYGLAGLRVGYGYGDPELISLLNRTRAPFNVNSVALAASRAALEDQDFVSSCRIANAAGLRYFEECFESLNIEYISSSANFITLNVGDGNAAFEAMQRDGIIVRPLRLTGWASGSVYQWGRKSRMSWQ